MFRTHTFGLMLGYFSHTDGGGIPKGIVSVSISLLRNRILNTSRSLSRARTRPTSDSGFDHEKAGTSRRIARRNQGMTTLPRGELRRSARAR